MESQFYSSQTQQATPEIRSDHIALDNEISEYDQTSDFIEVFDSVSNATSISSKLRTKSTVWAHFIPDRVQKKAQCKICLKQLSYKGATTSNLISHLKNHKDVMDKDGNLKDVTPTSMKYQPDIRSSFAAINEQYSDELLSDRLVELFVKQDESFLMIESQQFRNLIKLLRPQAKLFGADTLQRRIMERFELELTKKKDELRQLTSKISFTTDIWTSPAQDSFMAVTAHFIDADWNLHAIMLDFICIPGQHRGDVICDAFEEVLTTYGIEQNMKGITLDNASNNGKFIETLIERGKFKEQDHFRCFGHVINLAVQSALSKSNSKISKLRNAMRSIRSSPLKLRRLENICDALNPKIKFVKPVIDVPTRWNSTVDMLERALGLKRALAILFAELADDGTHEDQFTFGNDDWKAYESFCQFLSAFKSATKMASADKYPSLSLVVPLYNSLLDHAHAACDNPNVSDDLKMAAEACKAKLLAYYDVTSHSCTIATVLDPRLKLEYYRPDSDEDGHENVDELFKMVNQVFSEHYEPRERPIEEKSSDESNANDIIFNRIFKKRKIAPVSEFKDYCSSGLADKDTNPLVWWKANAHTYPNLARMAKDYLAIPGSSTTSERAFSSGRQTITDFRCSLSPQTIKVCQCLKSWL